MLLKVLSNKHQNQNSIDPHLLYEKYNKHVYHTAYFITKDAHIAHDVVQETFIRAFHYIDRVNDMNKIGAWLSVVATRVSIDFFNKQKEWPISSVDPSVLEGIVGTQSENSEEDQIVFKQYIHEKINTLSPEHRAVIHLKYIEDMKETDISNELGIKLGTVKSRLNRARKKLKLVLENIEKPGGDRK